MVIYFFHVMLRREYHAERHAARHTMQDMMQLQEVHAGRVLSAISYAEFLISTHTRRRNQIEAIN